MESNKSKFLKAQKDTVAATELKAAEYFVLPTIKA